MGPPWAVLGLTLLLVRHTQQLDTDNYFLQPSIGDVGSIGVPHSATVFLNAQTSCKVLPVTLRGYAALQCSIIKEVRKCAEAGDMDPLYFGRDCIGKQCMMHLESCPSSKVLAILGDDVDPNNKTRRATCGLDSQYSDRLRPFPVAYSNSGHCLVGLPPDVQLHSQFLCADGNLSSTLVLTFSQAPQYSYSCIHNPTCMGGVYASHITCYTEENLTNGIKHTLFQRPLYAVLHLLIAHLLWIVFSSYFS